MAVSVKARILLGFGLVLFMLIASAVVSSILISGIDTHFGEFRQALDRKSQADTIDLVMQQTRVRVNQWLRSLNPAFSKQADELLERSIGLLAQAKASAATDKERKIVGDIDTALTAYIKSWHVIQDLYAEEGKIYAEKIDAPGAGIRSALATVRDAEAAQNAVETSRLVAEARDGFMTAEAAAAHYHATLSKDDATKLQAAITGALASLGKAAPAIGDSGETDTLKTTVTALGAWRDAFNEAAKVAETRVARLDSWTKNEGEAMAVGAAALRKEGETAAASAQSAVVSTIASSHVVQYSSLAVILLAGVALSLLLARSITGPLARMTAALQGLAAGDRSLEVPETQRRDEIGAMAKAAQVFKDNAIAMERMQAEQEALKGKAEEEKRRALTALADRFEASVRGVVDVVSSSSTEMQAAAQSMTATAEETSRQSMTVSASAEQTSANVQTVASATEELSSSIAEIGRQVEQSAKIARNAVSEAAQTNSAVECAGPRLAAHRGGRAAHRGHRRPDQPPRPQRHHRGGARRRGRQGLCRRRLRGQDAGEPDRQGDRGHQGPDRRDPGRDDPDRRRDEEHRRHDRPDRRDRDRDRRRGRAAERADGRDREQRPSGGEGHHRDRRQHRRRQSGGGADRRRGDAGARRRQRAVAAGREAARRGRHLHRDVARRVTARGGRDTAPGPTRVIPGAIHYGLAAAPLDL